MAQTDDISRYLDSLPTADSIREQIARNEQERKLLQKLLRIADERETLTDRERRREAVAV